MDELDEPRPTNRSKPALAGLLLSMLLAPGALLAQGATVEIPFDHLPSGTELVAEDIGLQGDTTVTGDLVVTGATGLGPGGLVFDDGTQQLSAASGAPIGASANQGIYDNRIPDMSPPLAYSEVCLKNGGIQADIHTIGEPTAGGSCEPGDLGWIMERAERPAARWAEARLQCLQDGMRLPEVFELSISCFREGALGLLNLTQTLEWASNSAVPMSNSLGGFNGLGATVLGHSGNCRNGGWGAVARGDGSLASTEYPFRCAR